MVKKAEIVIVNATELKPGSKYIIGFDKRFITEEDVMKFMRKLRELGVVNAVGMISDNPNEAIRIIEQKDTESLL